MGTSQIRGKSLHALAQDVAEGYEYINALVLKKFDTDVFKSLHQIMKKVQRKVLSEKVPSNNVELLRRRNLKLQRLHQALRVLENTAKEKKIILH